MCHRPSHLAFLTAAALVAASSAGHAATPLYWPSSDFGGYERPLDMPSQPRPQRRPPMPKQQAAKAEKLAKDAGKPTGPLVIAVSITDQTLKVYDANGFLSETPISSGMTGHATPMGVFSVIQKNKWHRSNIYSDAPMPYMQRLTWSGIAMHAGVLPGYPASHGCIRMPMSFAVWMWGWTRMGARVVVTPGDTTPAAFAHPLLASIKAPAPVAASATIAPDKQPAALPAATGQKTADATSTMPVTAVSDVPAAAMPTAAPADTTPPADVKPVTAPKRGAPIAIFISRKDMRLYARQNFAPLFDAPVTISGDRPLGTHVFTAYPDKDAAKPVVWTAMTLPTSLRQTGEDDVKPSRKHHVASTVPPAVPLPSPTEALDRMTIADDVLARLGEQLTPGSSLVVSDQGIAGGETGPGTDFIVRLR